MERQGGRLGGVEKKLEKLDSMETSIKRMEMQIGQLAEAMHAQNKGKLPSQPEQTKALAILRSGKVLGERQVEEKSDQENFL